MSELKSLTNLYEIFPYDFYMELQVALLQNFDATLAEYSFAFPFSEEVQKTEIGQTLKNSIEARIKLFHTNRNEECSLMSTEDFNNHRIVDRAFMKFYHLDNAIPTDIATKLTYGLTEQNQEVIENMKNNIINIYVQLLDDNHNPLLAEDKELPEPCYSIYDKRLLTRIEYMKDNEFHLASIPTESTMWYNQKLNEQNENSK